MRYLFAVALLTASLNGAPRLLWRDPGAIERLNLAAGPGGAARAPKPPFRFIREDSSGTSPKVQVRDRTGARWSVKWGEEVKAETFASRLAWAAGYFVEPVYYVRSGRIAGVRNLGRADRFVDKRGYFRDARFELIDPSRRYLQTVGWTWEQNPFVGTRQLNGLKILLMFTSNWDNKDARDATSNTAIVLEGAGEERRSVYMVTDWGGSMGKWGNFFTREKWNCDAYAKQSPDFIKSVEEGEVKFGFSGKHDDEFKDEIGVDDVRWIMQYLGRISDAQIRSALRASGASRHEEQCFARAMRLRIRQLRQVARL
ncbi:MAG TPA: hypothetical protein VER03_15480 [Bryobacteraceae bacterium]|nr:hypothetical protein [Bryobacteraceae bacterium]